MKKGFGFLGGCLLLAACTPRSASFAPSAPASYAEPYRPQVHFSPPAQWMNDPNGMVFFNNRYHLFYQYYPDSTVWGPMHWGHATSADLVHWTHRPVALYPDSLGYIFSGSAVVDVHKTTGFGREGNPPLVAIFTHHDPVGEKAGRNDFQNQSLAYSLDEGATWTKYAGNPVLKNSGIRDFRDPKVMWYEAGKKWIMTLATLDRITFYSSPDLKAWTKESEFGKEEGAHGGVWECPDLFPLQQGAETVWVLLVSINPGGPNGGSATQYFTGHFDGKTFTPFERETRWIDYGPDNYAGITWSNTGARRVFLGWMNNWQYANVVPTGTWRGATTLPRELALVKSGGQYRVVSLPVKELEALERKAVTWSAVSGADLDLSAKAGPMSAPAKLTIASSRLESFALTLSNGKGEQVVVGYDRASNQYYIDRSRSGKADFHKEFAARHTAPRLAEGAAADLTLYFDRSSVELFADGGLSVMTSTFFPSEPFTRLRLQSPGGFRAERLQYIPLRSIWRDRRP